MIATKERPILFSAPMVRAILDGSKTQARRVVKPQPEQRYYLRAGDSVPPGEAWVCEWDGDEYNGMELHQKTIRCPYGAPDDMLWVRETWHQGQGATWGSNCVVYDADKAFTWAPGSVFDNFDLSQFKKRPPIFMPRWASRILLEITDVRVQRLQDISPDDAQAEGCSASGFVPTYSDPDNFPDSPEYESAAEAFARLWESINGPSSWDTNPWVWAITFRRLQP